MSRERKVKADNPALVTDPQDFREQTGVDYAVFLKAVKGKTGLTKKSMGHHCALSRCFVGWTFRKTCDLAKPREEEAAKQAWGDICDYSYSFYLSAVIGVFRNVECWFSFFHRQISTRFNIPYLSRLLWGYLSFSGVTILLGILSVVLKKRFLYILLIVVVILWCCLTGYCLGYTYDNYYK